MAKINNIGPSPAETGRIEGMPEEIQATALHANLAEIDFAIRAGGVEPPRIPSHQPKLDVAETSMTGYPHGGSNPALQVGPRNIPNRRIMI
ncbi:MAG TPA: hypothetical protein VFW77_03545 [Candidatus Saccharimonadales bacterium]|nr:hypothetical protein [Candidatus Saccharimonadales bacterium]